MYARRVKGRTLTFVVSGMLWQRSLVMMDRETGSLWSHLLGEAMRGPLEGERLEVLPSVMTDWATWRRRRPDTTVLLMSRTSKEYRRDFYRDLSQFVVAISGGGKARAWPFDQLAKQPVVNDRFDRTPLVVAFDKGSASAFLYERLIDGRLLTFRPRDGKMADDQSGSLWDIASGKAVEGAMRGSQLPPAVGVISYRRAWRAFHPDCEFWQAE